MEKTESLKIEIGKRLKTIREDKLHMSKQDFSQLIGMKPQYLATVESGKRGLTTEKVVHICNVCNISADYLLLGIDNYIETKAKELLSNYTNKEIHNAFEIMKNVTLIIK